MIVEINKKGDFIPFFPHTSDSFHFKQGGELYHWWHTGNGIPRVSESGGKKVGTINP